MYTSFIKMTSFITGALLLCLAGAKAQEPGKLLDGYIALAFEQNQGLKQQQFDLDRSLYALQEARSMFMPTVSMLASYTKAEGGRTIDVPVGDMLNPAYATLNQLTGSNKFPQLSNQSFLLNPDNFYDVKLRTSLPLINAEIKYNKLIKQQLITSQQASLNVYKRTLVRDIKTAYYRYYQALQGQAVYKSALLLVNENIRVNESMLRNGVRNGTALLRSQTEQQKTSAALVQAQRSTENARAYFNFLLNRPLQDSILIDSTALAGLLPEPDTSAGVRQREELQQLQTLQRVNELDYQLQQSNIIPKLSTFLDLGSQGQAVKVNDKTRYYLWGVNLQWDLFTGNQHKYRAAQARANVRATTAQLDETQQALQLQLTQSYNNYYAAKAALNSAIARLSFADKYYNDQFKAYKAGQLLYIELVDAQDQLTGARLQMAQAQADLRIALAELERDQATYPINTHN